MSYNSQGNKFLFQIIFLIMQISSKSVNINCVYSFYSGTFVTKVTATDADDPVYGNSAKLVYSILEGQPYFSIEPHTGR